MKDYLENIESVEMQDSPLEKQGGYTLIEILAVTALVVIVIMMTQGMMRNYKRFAFEETCVQRMKELARAEHIYRSSNDPTINPTSSYGGFFDLKNAGLIPQIYDQSDEKRHTVNAFIPNYRLDFVRSTEEQNLAPDPYGYMIIATPINNSLDLETFYVQEDGEVYFWEHAFLMRPR